MSVRFSQCDVVIVEFAATRVAVFAHRGDPALIGTSMQKFIAWRKQSGLPPKVSATFNILTTIRNPRPLSAIRSARDTVSGYTGAGDHY